MADQPRIPLNPVFSRQVLTAEERPPISIRQVAERRPPIFTVERPGDGGGQPAAPVPPPPPPTTGSEPPPGVAQPPPSVTLPQPAADDPFASLPLPNAGDRIKADDFRKLTQGLTVLADTYRLAGASFGQPFGVVRVALATQGYEIARAVTVTGAQLSSPDDTSFDNRTVVHVAPLTLGGHQVGVVVTEAAAAPQRRMPNLIGLTHRQAAERLQQELGDALAGAGPLLVPNLVGRTLGEAERSIG